MILDTVFIQIFTQDPKKKFDKSCFLVGQSDVTSASCPFFLSVSLEIFQDMAQILVIFIGLGISALSYLCMN
ncbi:hypothetical protein ACSBR2_016414 [Camellia fascicularis]